MHANISVNKVHTSLFNVYIAYVVKSWYLKLDSQHTIHNRIGTYLFNPQIHKLQYYIQIFMLL